jgi:proton-coupled amino acid transporter
LVSGVRPKGLVAIDAQADEPASIPLCFIYPPLLHLKACAKTRTAKALDYALLIFGIVVGIYTTVQTIGSLFQPGDGPPRFGKCEGPQGL